MSDVTSMLNQVQQNSNKNPNSEYTFPGDLTISRLLLMSHCKNAIKFGDKGIITMEDFVHSCISFGLTSPFPTILKYGTNFIVEDRLKEYQSMNSSNEMSSKYISMKNIENLVNNTANSKSNGAKNGQNEISIKDNIKDLNTKKESSPLNKRSVKKDSLDKITPMRLKSPDKAGTTKKSDNNLLNSQVEGQKDNIIQNSDDKKVSILFKQKHSGSKNPYDSNTKDIYTKNMTKIENTSTLLAQHFSI